MDAEPSLFNGRIKGTEKMIKTIDIKSTQQCDSVVKVIDKTLIEIGIHQNFAPVCDVSPNNEAIKSRSFGNNKDTVILLSNQFITTTQQDNIVATAKHFPGHGLVKGDTHKQSVYIDGELQELDIYKPLIANGVISIMVAHITVLNNENYNTNNLPSSCSRVIVTDLLKNELNFNGIIITDALNIMKAVTILDKAPLKASMAGCDMILMPIDELQTINWIEEEMKKNPAYKKQVYQSVKKILRLKICLNLL
jgi:beta-N-acetylhexosaminidase